MGLMALSMKSLICVLLLLVTLTRSTAAINEERNPAPSQPSASARARANRILAEKLSSDLKLAKCPEPLTSCPLFSPVNPSSRSHHSRPAGHKKKKIAWECLDLAQELTACGRCDNDCMKLPNVENVGCESGRCKIFTCKPGHSAYDKLDPITGSTITSCV
ncbi:hypothetical protein PTTG_09169 [Puccinia triticina 1-1 BBBD Race 1]|uniref:Protein CPL1-like domain-containing protein n=2 Tax=Puccinia triticina TaxID=208348 RepID=A0A180H283_PUCT1|nr:uncharacterized protein PtA15_4A175 [Puccinia triticina]OAV99136.1 hypothetical protein PTTG_09169 [Puccinia triticina 1-1 BBBD Race 1]WAQ83727.1 hypothetical protein PtA15_4A175 [Puccinia triticina]WAR54568.1 hypothetical protein PtB15_4B185 [Puccinia triticina]